MSQGLIDESLADYNKLGSRAQTVLGNEKYTLSLWFPKPNRSGK
jgi:hypothetical protein